ncbi:mRNA-degrading endonuclease RelE of RelBE toxin-antitoxin system [Catalinimonas alkaloidigena]|nr:mRNA-degrading endonuclease RelE of RelBE toxin-antitoxin system [Catalinimonas alkaloidigena]
MTIRVNKKFLKDLAKIPANERQKIEVFVFEESEKIKSLEKDYLIQVENLEVFEEIVSITEL